jgi:hypothetical protein
MTVDWVQQEGNIYRVFQTFSSVPANSSLARTAVPLNSFGGRILQVAISTANVIEFDFSLFQDTTSLKGSTHEVYRVEGATQFWQREKHDILFNNSETPITANLYFELTNTSLTVPSGVVTLQLYIQAPGSG